MELDEGWISGGVSAQGAHRPVSTAAARHSSSNQNQSGNLNAPAALSTPANQTQSSGWNAPTVQRPQPLPIFQVQRERKYGRMRAYRSWPSTAQSALLPVIQAQALMKTTPWLAVFNKAQYTYPSAICTISSGTCSPAPKGGERKEIGLVGKDDGVMVSSSESDGFNKDGFDAALSGPRARPSATAALHL
ncbi:hypothetical protein BKA80DRAFT_253521 [Phyllosticta citrichinensis]